MLLGTESNGGMKFNAHAKTVNFFTALNCLQVKTAMIV